MPVMCIIRASKVTPELYEAVREEVGWEKAPPAGALSHAISFTPQGAVEVNVWDSRARFEDYVRTRLQPVLDRRSIVFDDVQVLDTHNVAIGAPALEHMIPRPGEPDEIPEGPVIAVYRRRNVPVDLYNRFRALAPLDTVPEGSLAHVHGRTAEDIISIDVWSDGRAMVDYIRGTIIPAVKAAGTDFFWPELVPLTTFLTTPDAKAHEAPFAMAPVMARSALEAAS